MLSSWSCSRCALRPITGGLGLEGCGLDLDLGLDNSGLGLCLEVCGLVVCLEITSWVLTGMCTKSNCPRPILRPRPSTPRPRPMRSSARPRRDQDQVPWFQDRDRGTFIPRPRPIDWDVLRQQVRGFRWHLAESALSSQSYFASVIKLYAQQYVVMCRRRFQPIRFSILLTVGVLL